MSASRRAPPSGSHATLSTSSPVAVPLSSKTEEYRRVRYLLQLSLREKNPRELHIWHFSNEHQVAKFKQRTRDVQTLHGWVGVDELDAANTLESLHSRGFTFPASGQGMLFHAGNLMLARDGEGGGKSTLSTLVEESEEMSFRFILCSIGVGRSVVLEDLNAPRNLPKGFDSFFVTNSSSRQVRKSKRGAGASASAASGLKSAASEYQHDYILLDPAQALPLYLVQFTLGQGSSRGGVRRSVGGLGLQDDEASESQEIIRLTKADLTGPMTPVIQQIYDRYDFFDPILYVPVSVRDKMTGSHSTGEAAQHKLIGIGDAYDAALAESLKPDPLVSQRQAEIRAHLSAVEGKVRDINRNAAEVEEQIYQMLQDALFQLQDMTKQRVNTLLAEEVELQRQLQHIEWVESFLEQQREVATPVDFLGAWKCHVQLRADISKLPLQTQQVLNSVHANMNLHGKISVVAETDNEEAEEFIAQGVAEIEDFQDDDEDEDGVGEGRGGQLPPESVGDFEEKEDLGDGVSTTAATAGSLSSRVPERSRMGGAIGKQAKPQNKVEEAWNQALSDHTSQPRGSFYGDSHGAAAAAGPTSFTQRGVAKGPTSPPPPPVNNAAASTSIENISLELASRKKLPLTERCPPNLTAFSLSNEATRRLRQNKAAALPELKNFFDGSKIITNTMMNPGLVRKAEEEIRAATEAVAAASAAPDPSVPLPKIPQMPPFLSINEIQALTLALPFSDVEDLEMKLLYASWRDEKSLKALLNSMPIEKEVDVKGVESEFLANIPTVLLIRANGQVFGGYASQPWRNDGQGFGNPRCFLFSLSKDLKIPFQGRETLPTSPETVKYCQDNGLQVPKFAVLKSDFKCMQFGTTDLVIQENFTNCTSELEHSFGVRLTPGSLEAGALLADKPTFDIETLELWGVIEDVRVQGAKRR